jgi:hypothetical protein
MLLVEVAVVIFEFKKHDAAAAKIVILRLGIDDPSIDLDQVVSEAQGNTQALAGIKKHTGFKAQSRLADIEGAGKAAAENFTSSRENLVVKKVQGITAIRLAPFEQVVTHYMLSNPAKHEEILQSITV